MSTDLNAHLEACCLRLLITDGDFCRMAAGNLDPAHFTSTLAERLARLCLEYYGSFRQAPGDHFHDELVRLLARVPAADREDYGRYVSRLQEMPQPNREYVLRRLDDFVQVRAREAALVQAADLLAEGKVAEHDVLLARTLKTGIPSVDGGLDYLHDLTNVGRREHEGYMMPTGVAAMDRQLGGFNRKEGWTILGGMKAGKTWALGHMGRTALHSGLSVTHVSHEVSAEEQELRYDMSFTGRGTGRGGTKIGERVTFSKWDEATRQPVKKSVTLRSVYDAAAVAAARRKVARYGGKLRIKKYPMGQCRPAEIERLVTYLEEYENHRTDVLIVDYLDIMELSQYGREKRDQLNGAYVWMMGLADERNLLAFTASQVRREALERRRVRREDVAEDIRKMANVYGALAIGRGERDVESGIAGLSVVASRGGGMGAHCSFSLCYDIGQFCISSWVGSDVDEQVYEMLGGKDKGQK